MTIYIWFGIIIFALIVFIFLLSKIKTCKNDLKLNKLQLNDLQKHIENFDSLKLELDEYKKEYAITVNACENEKEKTKDLSRFIFDLKNENKILSAKNNDLRDNHGKSLIKEGDYKSIIAGFEIKLSEQEKQFAERKKSLDEDIKKNSREFENLANRIFDEKSKHFVEKSKSSLSEVLNPLNAEIINLKQKIDNGQRFDTEQRSSLREEIKGLHKTYQKMDVDAQNLTSALKGNNKIQGSWGEVVLKRVLENSGLREGYEYTSQKSFRDDNNKTNIPDIIISMPDNKQIIVDSKVSLVNYVEYCNSDNSIDKKNALDKHVASIRKHLDGLSNKNYENLSEINTLDFVLMFMPVEPAYIAAWQHDEKLFADNMYKQKVIIVTPTTLMAILGAINYTWKSDRQTRNTIDIAETAGKMYDKFVGFTEDFEKIGSQIDTVANTYGAGRKKLIEGRGNLISQSEKLRDLGVSTKKNLPSSLTEQAEIHP